MDLLEEMKEIARILSTGSNLIEFVETDYNQDLDPISGECLLKLDGQIVDRDIRIYALLRAELVGSATALLEFYVYIVAPLKQFLSNEAATQLASHLKKFGMVFFPENIEAWNSFVS